MRQYDLRLRGVLVGDLDSQKSQILESIVECPAVNPNNIPNIGVEFGLKYITLENGKTIKLQIWGTAGQESFRAITRSYYRGTDIIFLCLDVTSHSSCQNISEWHADFITHCSDNAILIIIGETSKIGNRGIRPRCFSQEDGQNLAENLKAEAYCELSVTTGDGVRELISSIANIVSQKYFPLLSVEERIETQFRR